MKKLLTVLALTLSLSLFAQAKATEDQSVKMSMTDTNGKTYEVMGTEQGIKIKGLEGKIVFLEFFGHQCPPCLASIPHLIDLQKKYKDKLAIVAIEVQGYNSKMLKQFAKQKGINYITVSESTASRLTYYIQQRAKWRGSIPFLVAMDTNGDVQFVQAGMLPEKFLEKLISELSPKKVKNKINKPS